MATVQVLVGESLHRAVKAAAALEGKTIREYTEKALREALPPSFLPGALETFIESGKAPTEERGG